MQHPEDPLESLIPKPFHLMSLEEATQFISEKRKIQERARDKKAYFDGTYERKVVPTIFDEL